MADVHFASQGTLDLRSAEDQKKEEELDKLAGGARVGVNVVSNDVVGSAMNGFIE